MASAPERLVDEPAQVGAVGDQREQPEDAEAVEVGDRGVAVQLASDADRREGLLVGLRQVGDRLDRARDAGREGASAAAADAADDPHDLGDGAHDRLRCRPRRARRTSATTSWLKPITGARGSRTAIAWFHARAKRSCRTPTSSGERVECASSSSVSATTTTSRRSMSHPSAAACATASVGEPARPARASRRNSARYLLSTAETACSLVMARAATVAARSSRWTSSAVSDRSPTKAASRPWLRLPADDPHHGPPGLGALRSAGCRPARAR